MEYVIILFADIGVILIFLILEVLTGMGGYKNK